MTATYTFDVFSSLDGYGSYGGDGDWGGYWGKQGPELLDHRLASFDAQQRMVFGADTFRQFVQMLASSDEEPEAKRGFVLLPRRWVVERSFAFSRTTKPRRRIFSMMLARVAAVPMPLSFITSTIATVSLPCDRLSSTSNNP